jgi:hypothetical protein
MSDLVSGMLVAGYLVAGLHFLKFWRRSRDRLFVMFAVVFWVLAVQRAALAFTATLPTAEIFLYALRLAAFVLIIVAIVDKNRAAST